MGSKTLHVLESHQTQHLLSMPKRGRDDGPISDTKRVKKTLGSRSKAAEHPRPKPLALKPTFHLPTSAPKPVADIDFPRGGGSSFTPVETKAIRAEALREIKDEEIFKVRNVHSIQMHSSACVGLIQAPGIYHFTPRTQKETKIRSLRKSASVKTLNAAKKAETDKDRLRIEHLNYKACPC